MLPAYAAGGMPPPPPAPGQRTPNSTNTCMIAAIVGAVAVVMFIAMVGILAAILLPALARAREAARRASCQNNEKQLGLIFLMVSNEHEGAWPALSPETGFLQPDWSALGDEFLADRSILVCPSDPLVNEEDVLAGRDPGSFYYLGYIIRDQKEMEAFAAAYRARLSEGGGVEEDLAVPPEHGGGVIRRLTDEAREELAKQGVDDSTIPVLFERAESHVPGGMNVLYIDGDVKFLKTGTEFPATQEMVDVLEGMQR